MTPSPAKPTPASPTSPCPSSEFLDHAHIGTICTRVQFAAGAGNGSQCPKGAVYGHAKARTPLLDYPVKGPVFLRCSNHNLPDMVVALHGPPSRRSVRTRRPHRLQVKAASATPSTPPPTSRSPSYASDHGGKKGLLVNSRNICAHHYRARANMKGHNNRRNQFSPAMSNSRCNKKSRKRNHKRHAVPPGGRAGMWMQKPSTGGSSIAIVRRSDQLDGVFIGVGSREFDALADRIQTTRVCRAREAAMTDARLRLLDRVFSSTPAFEFISPEGHVGYPGDLLELEADRAQQLIGALRAYECEAINLQGAGASPVPDAAKDSPNGQRG